MGRPDPGQSFHGLPGASCAGGSRLHQDHKVQRASGDSMMCCKKCLYGTLQAGVQKGEGRLAWRELEALPEKARWAGLITAWLCERDSRDINQVGSPSPKSRVSSKPGAPAAETKSTRPVALFCSPWAPGLPPHGDMSRLLPPGKQVGGGPSDSQVPENVPVPQPKQINRPLCVK